MGIDLYAAGLPSAPDSAALVVGSLLIDPSRVNAVAKIVQPADFSDPYDRAAIDAIFSLRSADVPIDVVTVCNRLAKLSLFQEYKPAVYLAEAGRKAEFPAHVEHHAKEVAKAAKKRRICLMATDAAQRSLDCNDPDALLGDIRLQLDAFEPADKALSSLDAFEEWAVSVEQRVRPKLYTCAPYGCRLREVPVGDGLVTLFGAPPAGGKTALIMQLMLDALQLDDSGAIRILVANVEMSPHTLLNRQLARFTKVGHSWIANRDYDEDATPRIQDGIALLRSLMPRLEFLGPPFTLDRLTERAKSFGANIVVVDYAQRFDFAQRSSDQRSQTNAVMDVCRRLADQGRAVVVVSAVNRQGYAKDTASIASFRESSELEYGADAAYLLIQDDQDQGAVTLRCVKNRHGQMRDIPLRFDGSYQSFTDDKAAIEWNPE